MTHMRACTCCDDGDPPNPCPAPCVVVIISGLQYYMAGTDDPCYLSGGVVGQSVAGLTGAFLLNRGHPGYTGSFPVQYAMIQSEGTQSDFTTWIGGSMRINVGVGACENGVIQGFNLLSAGCSGGSVNSFGELDPNPNGPGPPVFGGSFPNGLIPMGQSVSNTLILGGGCTRDSFSFIYGGTATVIQPPGCTLDPVYHYAIACDGSGDRIVVDLFTIPPEGAAGCRFGGRLYRLVDESTQDQPVSVEWVNEICNTQADSWPVAVRCDNHAERITYDPDLKPLDGRTCLLGLDRYIPNSQMLSNPPSVVIWTPDQCLSDGGGPSNPCLSTFCQVGSPNFPNCCASGTFRNCPQCSNQINAGAGSWIERTIQRISRGKVKSCQSCKNRRDFLDRLSAKLIGKIRR